MMPWPEDMRAHRKGTVEAGQHGAESQGWQKINNLRLSRAGRKPSPGAVLGPLTSRALFQSPQGLAVWLGL